MSGPKVDLKPIDNLYLENLIDSPEVLGSEAVAKVFEGSGLYLDTKTGQLKTEVNGEVKILSLEQEANALRFIKKMDANGDKELTIEEVTPELQKNKDFAKFDPAEFMKYIDGMVTKRWSIIARNMQSFAAEVAFKPLLDSLDTYNNGLYWDDIRQATSVMPLNSLGTKTVLNILTFPRNLARVITKGRFIPILPHDTVSDDWNYADQMARNSAETYKNERSAAIAELRKVITEGSKAGEEWAKSGNFDEAFKKLSEKSQKLLSKNIPAKKIYDIISIKDDKERYAAMKTFAEGERPGTLGYGGGNATGWDTNNWFNITGRHNNIVFARSITSFLGSKAAIGDDLVATNKLHDDANLLSKDILGDKGGFTNIFSWLCTGILHYGTLGHVDITPRRAWGDEAKMDGVGRGIDAGIMLFLSYKGLKSMGAARDLKGVAGGYGDLWKIVKENPEAYASPWKVMDVDAWKGMSKLSKFGNTFRIFWNEVKPFSKSAFEGPKEQFAEEIANGSREAPKPGWIGRKLGGLKDKLFGKLPDLDTVLSPDQLKLMKTGGAVTSTAGKIMTYGSVMLYITQNVDKSFEAKYNPYETDHELEVDPFPDPTKPDPLLYMPIKK